MLKRYLIGLITLFLVGCAAAETGPSSEEKQNESSQAPATSALSASAKRAYSEQTIRSELDDYGLAPELINEVWLNTDQPLRLSELQGKVVLLDMWTFG